MCGRLRGDSGVVGFPGRIADGELDDLVQEAAALAGGQTVGVDDGGELAGPVRDGRQVLEPGADRPPPDRGIRAASGQGQPVIMLVTWKLVLLGSRPNRFMALTTRWSRTASTPY
jgi:hypothetical protein